MPATPTRLPRRCSRGRQQRRVLRRRALLLPAFVLVSCLPCASPHRAQQPHLERRGKESDQRDAEEEGQDAARVALAGVEKAPGDDVDDEDH